MAPEMLGNLVYIYKNWPDDATFEMQIAGHPELSEYVKELRHGTSDDMQALMDNLDQLALDGLLEGWEEACGDVGVDFDSALYGEAAVAGRAAAQSAAATQAPALQLT